MIEGLLRHCTDADDRRATTSTPTARTVVGFAFTDLLGFRLLPRLKNIGADPARTGPTTQQRLRRSWPGADAGRSTGS